MSNVADQVGPGYAVSGFDQPRMSDWSKRLADIGGVCYISVRGEEDGAKSACVGCVADIRVCGFTCSDGLALGNPDSSEIKTEVDTYVPS